MNVAGTWEEKKRKFNKKLVKVLVAILINLVDLRWHEILQRTSACRFVSRENPVAYIRAEAVERLRRFHHWSTYTFISAGCIVTCCIWNCKRSISISLYHDASQCKIDRTCSLCVIIYLSKLVLAWIVTRQKEKHLRM